MHRRQFLIFAALCFAGQGGQFSGAVAQQSGLPSFDTTPPLESRIGGDISEMTKRSYSETGRGVLTAYAPTEGEKRKVAAALAVLTPLQRRIAQERLRSITFANGLVSNAQTTKISGLNTPNPEFEIVLNPILLKETVSEFLSRKERQLFDASGSSLSVSIDGGSMDAVANVLLHEATHIVDMFLKLSPPAFYRDAIPDEAHTPFTRGIWQSIGGLAAPYHDPIFSRVSFAPNAKTIPVAEARSLYEALARTPLVSIYGSRGYPEDIPELVACWQMTQKLKQPYRIEIRDGGRVVYAYEPMTNPLVQSRFGLLARFDS